MRFNTSGQKLQVFAFDSTTGAPVTGDAANITLYHQIDGGSVVAIADTSAAELSSTNLPGWYQVDLTQAETNGQSILFGGKSSTADVVIVGGVYATTPDAFGSFVTPTGAAVGSVTGDVGGDVLGSVATVTAVTDVTGNVQGNVLGNVAGTVAGVVAPVVAHVTQINSVVVTGVGTVADPWIGS